VKVSLRAPERGGNPRLGCGTPAAPVTSVLGISPYPDCPRGRGVEGAGSRKLRIITTPPSTPQLQLQLQARIPWFRADP